MYGRQALNRVLNASPSSILRKVHLMRDPELTGDLGQIKLTTLQDMLAHSPVIRVCGTYRYVDGSLPWCDIVALLSIVVARAPRSLVEIGTLHGHTTKLLSLNLPNSEIHTIDLPQNGDLERGELRKDDFHLIHGRRLGEEYRSCPSITNVTQHLGDTATMPFPRAELFYIDGSHTYDYVKSDTKKAMAIPEAKTFIWHDCDRFHTGVTRWLKELSEEGYPVRRIAGTNIAVMYRDDANIAHSLKSDRSTM